ncbi:ChaB family protein [Gilvimarinus sp. F26214L]|uniref:ChaB family protein n=1 Tax=Gilvimarinus sp. DZF01 TaxID=3461371 RepID=UPI0040462317
MGYASNAQLPRGVQSYLSPEAQDIYREAYNHAWETYRYAQDRYDRDDSRQVTASRIAWETVKRECSRDQRGHWVLDSVSAAVRN